jgi:hypothetical protein
MTSDVTAEICEGAAGCACGSQEGSGTNPAFMPKPVKNKRNNQRLGWDEKNVSIAENSNEPSEK